MSIASRTPKHMPRCSAMRTLMVRSPLQGNRNIPCDLTSACPRLLPSLLHDRLQVIQVARERLLPGPAQAAGGLWPPADELLVDGDVTLVFELLQVHAQIAVGHFQGVAQVGEGQTVRGSEHR